MSVRIQKSAESSTIFCATCFGDLMTMAKWERKEGGYAPLERKEVEVHGSEADLITIFVVESKVWGFELTTVGDGKETCLGCGNGLALT